MYAKASCRPCILDRVEVFVLQGHEDSIITVRFDPSGKHIVTASNDRSAKVWEASTGALVSTLSRHTLGVINAAFIPDGERILTTSLDNTTKVWDLEGHELLTLPVEGRLIHAIWSPDGARIVAALGLDDRSCLD